MDPTSQLGVVAATLASLVVGVRLLLLAWRSRELPELAMGLALTLSGGVAVLLYLLVSTHPGIPGHAAFALRLCARLCTIVGAVGVGLFTWQVFRPTPWGAGIFTATTGLALSGFAGHTLTSDPLRFTENAWFWLGFAARTGTHAWCSVESLVFHARMRRRRALGLAEPLVVNRVLLWGVTMGMAVAIHGVSAAEILAPHEPVSTLALARSALSLATALLLWLAFFPPAAYRRRFALGR
jgi:hypothetical protein